MYLTVAGQVGRLEREAIAAGQEPTAEPKSLEDHVTPPSAARQTSSALPVSAQTQPTSASANDRPVR